MLKHLKSAKFLLPVLLLAACATSQPTPRLPDTLATLTFQNGQTATINVNTQDAALRNAFLAWAGQGAYTQTPVYRQLPGVFILTGKPRLAGNMYQPGQAPSTTPKETHFGHVGLVKHTDGTVGPELILVYGASLTSCCEAPANVRIGTITDGKLALRQVARGDNLETIRFK